MLRLGLYTGASRTAMARASLILDFLMPTLDKRIDFTRTTAATYVDSDGYIKSTPASKNLLTYTQDFDNTAWVKTGVTAYPFDPAMVQLGPELVTNGDFSSVDAWTLNATAPATATIAGGKLTLVSPAGETASAYQSIVVAGRWYKVTGSVVVRSGSAKVDMGAVAVFTSTQSFTVFLQASGTFALSRNGACDADFDNISVREVIGGWITAPDGTLTADKLEETTTGGTGHWAFQSTTTIAAAHTFSVYMKGAGRTWGLLRIRDSSGNDRYAWFNLATGVVGTVQANLTASISSAGGGWYRCSITVSAALAGSNPCVVGAANADNSLSYTGDGTSGLYLWGAQLEAVPDANLVLGSELRGGGVVSTAGSPSPLATYNTTTGEATLNRVDGSNVSGVSIPVGGAGRAIRVSVTITATTGTVQVRGNGIAGTILGTVGSTAGTYLLYVVSDTTNIYLTMSSNATTASITVNSIREITGTTGMPTTYTRNVGGRYPPRFDYNPVTLAPRGLLIEEQRTNLLTYSEQFDNAAWVKTNATIAANAVVSPDGTTDADKLVETTGTGSHRVNPTGAISLTSGTAYTATVYAKAGERTRCVIITYTGATDITSVFDLSAGSVVSGPGTITAVGGGWYRLSQTYTAAATLATLYAFQVGLNNGSSNSYTGDGTSGIYVWGAQLEAGAFATSYIPTQASQVTRTADSASITGANFSQWYNQSAGTFVLEFQTLMAGAVPASVFALTADGNTSKRFVYIGSGADQASTFDGTTIITAIGDITGSAAKVASTYDVSGRAIVSNGGSVTSGSVVAGYSTASSLSIGGFGGNISVGHIRSIRYYPTRLSNAQLQALTAP